MDDRRVPEVLIMVDYFVEALLPNSHETINVDAIISGLRQRGTIAGGNGDHVKHWVAFDKEYGITKSPKAGTKHEDDVFKPLKLIRDAIAVWLQMSPSQTVIMKRIAPNLDWGTKPERDAANVTKVAADWTTYANTDKKADDSEDWDSDHVRNFTQTRYTLLTFRSA